MPFVLRIRKWLMPCSRAVGVSPNHLLLRRHFDQLGPVHANAVTGDHGVAVEDAPRRRPDRLRWVAAARPGTSSGPPPDLALAVHLQQPRVGYRLGQQNVSIGQGLGRVHLRLRSAYSKSIVPSRGHLHDPAGGILTAISKGSAGNCRWAKPKPSRVPAGYVHSVLPSSETKYVSAPKARTSGLFFPSAPAATASDDRSNQPARR